MKSIKKFAASILQKILAPWRWFKKTSLVKKIGVVIVMLIVIFIAYGRLHPQKSNVTLETVTRGDIVSTVSESGNVQASSQFAVYSPATGYLEAAYIQNGDIVKVGQNLFRVKSTATPQEKAAALANYLQAKAALGSAQATEYSLQSSMFTKWQTYLNLATNGTYQNADLTPNDPNRTASEFHVAQDDWLATENQYINQQQVVNQAQAATTNTYISYQATQDITVTAPAAGQVANFEFAVGDTITASSATAVVQTPVLVIGDFSKMIVKIPLNEVDVNAIKPGQAATLTFDAMRDTPYKGHVDNVDLVGTNTAGVITYNAYIVIDNPDANIKPAMTVTVDIQTADHPNVLTVPNAAIKPYKGSKAVIEAGASGTEKASQVKDKSGKLLPFHYVPITVGLKGITDTEVTSGVADGTKVVTNGITL